MRSNPYALMMLIKKQKMSKYVNELKDIIKQYELAAHLGDFSKKLSALSSLIDTEAIQESELAISAGNYESSILIEFIEKDHNTEQLVGTGLRAFDRIIGGFKKGEFLIIAGLKGMGKTTLMIEIANHWASKGKSVGFLSFEESAKSITKKFLANIGRFNRNFFNKEIVSQESILKLSNAIKTLNSKPIYLYETPQLYLKQLIQQIKKMVAEKKVEIVFIDYLELIIEEELVAKQISKRKIIITRLKQLAIELNIVLIICSKLPDNSYNSTAIDNTPDYTDLMFMGLLDPYTDFVLIHRLEYFGIEVDENNQPTENRMNLILSKYSTGTYIEIPAKAEFEKSSIVDFEYTDFMSSSI